MKYYILSNKSDCGNLSIWKFEGTEKECYKMMQALILATAANSEPGNITQIIMDDSDLTGYIAYSDGEKEDFRIVSRYAICDILDYDNVGEINTDAIPDRIIWNEDDVNYNVFDIGRE